MKLDLDRLREEIEAYLKEQGFVVFHGFARLTPSALLVDWNAGEHPDFREFLETARQAGVRLVIFQHHKFTAGEVDDAAERLEAAELPREDHRRLERRLKALRQYEGFTCNLSLSFDLGTRIYHFGLRTEWYDDLLDLLDEVDAAFQDEDDFDEDEDEPMGGLYSRN